MLSDNLLLIYELLEEFMDDGHVQISSSRGMKPFIINQPITRSIFSSLEFPNIKPFGTDHVPSSSSPPPLPLLSSSSSVATTRSSSTVMTMQKTPTDISKTSSPSSSRKPAASTSSSISLPKTKTTAAATTTSSQKYDIYVDVIESYDVIIGNGKNDGQQQQQQQQQQHLSGKIVTRSNVPAGNSRVIIRFDHDIRISDGDEDRPLATKNDINRLEKCHFYGADVDVRYDQLNNIKSISYSVGDNDEHIVMTYCKQMNGHQQQQQPPFTLACKQTSIPNSKDVSVSLTLTFNGHNNNNNNYNNNNNNNKSGSSSSSSSSSIKVVKCVVSIPLSTLVKEVTFENQPSQRQQYTLVHCNNKQQNNDVIVDSKQQWQPTDDDDVINERPRGCIQNDEILYAEQDNNINSKQQQQQNHLDVINDEEQHNNDVINEEQPHSINNNKLIWNLNSALQVNQPITVKFKLVVEQMTSSSSSPSTTTSSSSPLLEQALIDFELSSRSSVSGLKISSINVLDSINQPDNQPDNQPANQPDNQPANQPVTRHRQPQHQYNKWIRYIITSGLYAVNLD